MAELGKIWSGFEMKKAADSEAAALRERAKTRRAEAGAAAREERRQGELLASRAQAIAAASGGSLSDPTMIKLIADLEASGEYNALSRMFEGEVEARGFEKQAGITKRKGRARLATSVLSSASSLSDRG